MDTQTASNGAHATAAAAVVLANAPDGAAHVSHGRRPVSRRGSIASPDGRMEVRFENITYNVTVADKAQRRRPWESKRTVNKTILSDVSGIFRPGKMTAIMGASGAGKTSLLQLLAGEARAGVVTGRITLNGEPATPEQVKKVCGLVFQDDIILSTMTVREALTMAAILRLPKTLTMEERTDRVDEVIEMLKLEKAAEVVVGDSEVKGISGGERKRLALGMELINNPYLLFLDEFSSGLDTFTAQKVGEILVDLARNGRTVVSTIHQPSSDLFFLFDDLLLLAEGQTVYYGPTRGVIGYFERLGFKIPLYTNPIDWIFMNALSVFVDTPYPSAVGDPEKLEPAAQRIARLIAAWKSTSEAQDLQAALAGPTAGQIGISSVSLKHRRGFFVQLGYLVGRSAKNAWRNKLMLQARAGQSIIFGFLIGLTYLNLPSKNPAAAVQNYSGVLFFMTLNQVMMNLMGILNVFAEQKAVFRRENGAGYYSLSAFFFSKLVIELPLAVIFAWLMSTIIYWLVYLPATAGQYFIAMLICSLAAVIGMFMGVALASSIESLNVALALAPVILLPLMIFSGLFVQSSTIPPWFDWIKWISPMKYGFEAMIKELVPQFTAILGLDDGLTVGEIIAIMFAFSIGLMLLSWLALWRVTVAGAQKAKWQAKQEKGGSKQVEMVQLAPGQDALV